MCALILNYVNEYMVHKSNVVVFLHLKNSTLYSYSKANSYYYGSLYIRLKKKKLKYFVK